MCNFEFLFVPASVWCWWESICNNERWVQFFSVSQKVMS